MRLNFNGVNKAITFSFDDAVTQDIRLIELLNKYNLKCTFNVNSELLSKKVFSFVMIKRYRITKCIMMI